MSSAHKNLARGPLNTSGLANIVSWEYYSDVTGYSQYRRAKTISATCYFNQCTTAVLFLSSLSRINSPINRAELLLQYGLLTIPKNGFETLARLLLTGTIKSMNTSKNLPDESNNFCDWLESAPLNFWDRLTERDKDEHRMQLGVVQKPYNPVVAFEAELPEGVAHMRWSIFEEYIDGDHDFDLYLFYCPRQNCVLIDRSAKEGSNEEVYVSLPRSDTEIQDDYVVFVHAFETEGGPGGVPANAVVFGWAPFLANPIASFITQSPPNVKVGGTANVGVNWNGIRAGSAAKEFT